MNNSIINCIERALYIYNHNIDPFFKNKNSSHAQWFLDKNKNIPYDKYYVPNIKTTHKYNIKIVNHYLKLLIKSINKLKHNVIGIYTLPYVVFPIEDNNVVSYIMINYENIPELSIYDENYGSTIYEKYIIRKNECEMICCEYKDEPIISEDCPICFKTLGNVNKIVLICGHQFCNICFLNYYKKENINCPLCRSDIFL